ncbi:hypothetical protein E2562_033393 [Oryza meyeriana var. granulata]|uniref:Uncharacterized protein n=1 Tax=Oryza meyeriana var. granulata TaxID=110450 RepID=A0A6G1C0L9_9ORYZ|nr:hypothetical protein E2562_033393 [Oryza meyeriana var. granulata]
MEEEDGTPASSVGRGRGRSGGTGVTPEMTAIGEAQDGSIVGRGHGRGREGGRGADASTGIGRGTVNRDVI